MDVKLSIFSGSMHAMSRSYGMARQAEANLKAQQVEVAFFDLREHDLDFCSRPEVRDNPQVDTLRRVVQ